MILRARTSIHFYRYRRYCFYGSLYPYTSAMQRITSATLVLLSALQAANAQLFTVNCQVLTQQRADPVIFPGIVSPHG